MARKIRTLAKSASRRLQGPPAKIPKNSRKLAAGKSTSRPRKKPAEQPVLAVRRPPPSGEGKRGEKGYLAYLLRQAQAATRLAMERALSDLGVTTPQFVVLTMLKAYPGLSGADLARVAVLTPQTVGVIVRNLERDGAIKKTAHPIHGRVLQWTVTRRGAALLSKCRRRTQAIERRLVSGLSIKAQATIRRWLSGIASDFQ